MSILKKVDVAVIGAGTMGSMALWQVSKTPGLSVLGIEQYGPAHANGAFAGESRLFRVAAKEGQIYVKAALKARDLWTELEHESKREILLRTGCLSIAPEGHQFLDFTLKSIRDYNLPHRILDADQLRHEYPQFYIEDGDLGVLDVLGGALRCEMAVAAATQTAVAQGAEMMYNTAVLGIEEVEDGVLVQTDQGTVLADKVAVTSGSWTTAVMPELKDLIEVVTYALTWFIPDDVSQFMPDKFPGFMRDLDGAHAFGVPTLDGFSIKVSPTIDLPVGGTPEGRVRVLDRETIEKVSQEALSMIPGLNPEPSRWSTHPESATADHVPVIDVNESGRITVAGGMSGNGFKFAPAYGQIVADLMLCGASELQHPMFRLENHRKRAAARAAGLPAEGEEVLRGH